MTDNELDLEFDNILNLQNPKLTVTYVFKFLMLLTSILHLFFCSIFFSKNAYVLSYYNFISFILYVMVFTWNNEKNFLACFCISFLEVLVHSFLTDYYIGSEYGFYLYNTYLLPLLYFFGMKKNKIKRTYFFSILILFFIIILKIDKPIVTNVEENFKEIKRFLYNFNISVSWIFMNLLILAYVYEMKFFQELLEKKNQALNYRTNIDTLTKIPNRSYMQKKIKILEEDFKKNKIPFAILIGDIDNFKSFNDKYGHYVGDEILVTVSKIFKKYSQENQNITICRWGGEEFLIVIKNSSVDNAKEIGEDILKSIRNHKIYHNDEMLKVTMTIGGSIYQNLEHNFEDILKIADNNLYIGKSKTKDCIVIY